MFVVTKEPTFIHDIDVLQPVDNGHETKKLRTRFRVVPLSTLEALDLETSEGSLGYLDNVVDGFEDLVDEDKKPLESTDALRATLLDLPYIRIALVRGYMQAVRKVKLGN